MVSQKTLFEEFDSNNNKPVYPKKEVMPVDKLKELEEKISTAIERVRTLKEEKAIAEKRIRELEQLLDEKNQEIEQLKMEKNLVKNQIESLLDELEAISIE